MAVVGHVAAGEMVMEVKRILPKVRPTVVLILRLLIRLLNLGTFQPQRNHAEAESMKPVRPTIAQKVLHINLWTKRKMWNLTGANITDRTRNSQGGIWKRSKATMSVKQRNTGEFREKASCHQRRTIIRLYP